MLETKNFFGDFIKLRSELFNEFHEWCCPICGYNYIHREKAYPIDYSDSPKTSGIAIKFNGECGHIFYIVMEDYKGNSYMTYTDQNFKVIKPVVPEKPKDEMTKELVKAFQSMNFVDKIEIMHAVLEKTKMKGNK